MALDDSKSAVVKLLEKQRDGALREFAGRERRLREHAERMRDPKKQQDAIKVADKMNAAALELKAKFDKSIAEKSKEG